jgi:hypothetical protein
MRPKTAPAGEVGILFRFGRSRVVEGPKRLWLVPRIDELVVVQPGRQMLEAPGARAWVRVVRPRDAATKVSQLVETAMNKLAAERDMFDGEDVRALVDPLVVDWGLRVEAVDLEPAQ